MKQITLCPRCGERLEPGWSVCWKCAGEEADRADEVPELSAPQVAEDPDEATARRVLVGACVVVIGLCVYSEWGLTGVVTWLALVALLRVLVADIRRSPRAVVHDVNDETDAELDSDRTELADNIAHRAFRAALFGLVIVPPLALYALYLTARLREHRQSLSPQGRRRRTTAVLMAIFTVALWVVILAGMEVGLLSEFFRH